MALTIKWTKRARETFADIIEYLEENWTEREIKNFIAETNKVIGHITIMPLMFRRSSKKEVHEAVIVPQCILIYRIKKKEIQLLAFFDTKQNPKKKSKHK